MTGPVPFYRYVLYNNSATCDGWSTQEARRQDECIDRAQYGHSGSFSFNCMMEEEAWTDEYVLIGATRQLANLAKVSASISMGPPPASTGRTGLFNITNPLTASTSASWNGGIQPNDFRFPLQFTASLDDGASWSLNHTTNVIVGEGFSSGHFDGTSFQAVLESDPHDSISGGSNTKSSIVATASLGGTFPLSAPCEYFSTSGESDTAEEYVGSNSYGSNGYMYLHSSDIELSHQINNDGTRTEQVVGMRIPAVHVRPNTNLTSMTSIALEVDEIGQGCSACPTYEFGGIFHTPGSSYSWVSQAATSSSSGWSYADPTMIAVFLPASTADQASLNALETEGASSMAQHPSSCTDVYSGATITPAAGQCFRFVFPTSSGNCRTDLCRDYGNDCCAPGSEPRVCGESGYIASQGLCLIHI